MKTVSTLSQICLVFLLIAAAGCKKDNDYGPSDFSKFFRLHSFEVGVVPESRTVQVLFQVTDLDKKGVSKLATSDFIVKENEGEIDSEADLRIGQGTIPFAIRTVLLLDITRSVEAFIPQIKEAARSLVQKKLPEQEIAIYTFDAATKAVQTFTTDSQALLDAINTIPESGLVNSTNIYGAVIDVADLWEDAYSIEGIVDGSLIIFTDGRHNASQFVTLEMAQNALGNRRAYVAALSSPDLDEVSLKKLAKDPARYFKADDVAGLEQMFLDIQSDIQSLSNSIYFLYYQSPISDPTPFENDLIIEVRDNTNTGSDRRIVEKFNSEGFGN
ncbi:MAG: VWA domain-containing protein [Saprospiraceae bacterium]